MVCNIRGVIMRTAVIALLAMPGTEVEAREPTLDDALAATALDLIQSYMFTHSVVHSSIPMAEMGVIVHLGSEKITERNAAKKLKKYQRRLDIYTEAINQRGFGDVTGRYVGQSTESCERCGAFWLGSIGTDSVRDIVIAQDWAGITVTLKMIEQGEDFDFEVSGFVLESSLVLMDPMNSDYYIHGKVQDGRIELRPDPRVVDAWPAWAGPPDREDVKNCRVDLVVR